MSEDPADLSEQRRLIERWLKPGVTEAIRSANLTVCLAEAGGDGRTPASLEQLRALAARLQHHEPHLERLQQLASLGSMAASVAHEARNAITGARGCAQLLVAKQGDAEELLQALDTETKRCVDILSRFLDTARGEADSANIDVAALVESVALVVRHHLQLHRIELVVDQAPGPATVRGSLTELRQVLLNLVLNAQQAMPEGGRVHLSVAVDEGGPIRILVTDTGPGVPADLAPRVFEPFCTTKPAEQGVGLGLAVSRAIVERHGGTLTLEPSEGRGARFALRLPAAR